MGLEELLDSDDIPDELKDSIRKDISERDLKERELEEVKRRYQSIIDGVNTGVAVYRGIDDGEDFEFIDFNSAAEQIDGVKKEELLGRRVTEVFPGVKEFGLFEKLQNVYRTGEQDHHPITHYKDDRVVGWRENFVFKISQDVIAAVYNDASEEKKREEALWESQRKLKTLMSNLPGMAYRCYNTHEWPFEFVSEGCLNCWGSPLKN